MAHETAVHQMTTQPGATTSSTYSYAGPGQDELLSQHITAGDNFDPSTDAPTTMASRSA